MLKPVLRKALVKAANNSLISKVMGPLRRCHVPVFMLHRMEDSERGVKGHSPDFLRTCLSYLKEKNYNFLSLDQLIQGLDGKASIPDKSVVFTIDDGFIEQATIAVPIFEEFGCPVSIFLLGNFSSEISWPWDYQIEYIINTTKFKSIDFKNDKLELKHSISSQFKRRKLIRYIRDRLKKTSTENAQSSVNQLAVQLQVEVNSKPPESYLPITWEFARRCESSLIQFGPHTMDHSILAFQSNEQSETEVIKSWDILEKELANPLNVMCYPTGRLGVDFGEREIGIVRDNGFRAGLSVTPGFVDLRKAGSEDNRYNLQRFGLPDTMDEFIQLCSWVEVAKEKIRGK